MIKLRNRLKLVDFYYYYIFKFFYLHDIINNEKIDSKVGVCMLKLNKFKIIVICVAITLSLAFIIPTFARYKELKKLHDITEWDGNVAVSFKSGDGTQENPYIISNASEFAYFSQSLQNDDYEGKYVKLTNDIVINEGIFNSTDNKYTYNNNEYYIYGINYYNNIEYSDLVGTLNIIEPLNNFKGSFDGDFNTIFGLYLVGDNKALFTNLKGNLSNLYIENAYITDGYMQAGVVLNAVDSNINNVVFDGSVIGKNREYTEHINDNLNDITITNTYSLNLSKPISSDYSATLRGTCTGSTNFRINGIEVACSSFEQTIDPFNTTITTDEEITLSNLTYELSYSKNLSSGVILSAINSNIDGVINKGNVLNVNTSGILGFNYNSNVTNSYNKGELQGSTSSSITNTIINSNNINYTNVYNVGILNATNNYGLINEIVNTNLNLSNSFNMSNVDAINNKTNSNVTITNSYNKKYNYGFNLLESNINNYYKEYIDDEHISEGNIYIYDEYPILYFDDLKNTIAQIKIGDRIYNRLNNDVNTIYVDNELSVLFTTTNSLKPIKEAYIYLSDTELTENELNTVTWNNYEGRLTISDEGTYIIYSKLIDYSGNTYYINTDKFILDFNPFKVNITSNNYNWNNTHEVSSTYINDDLTYQITASDNMATITSIKYIISNEVVSNLDEVNNWLDYNGSFKVESDDSYIIYTKVTNSNNVVSYVNSDLMVPAYYNVSDLKSGVDLTFNSNMTYNSSFNFNVLLDHELLTNSNINRYIKVDKLLPNNTNIIIKDLLNEKVYYYIVNNIDYIENNGYLYDLSLFKEIGRVDNNYFDNTIYNDEELFNVYFDFSNILSTTEEYNISFIALDNQKVINTYVDDSINIKLNSTINNISNSLLISTTNTNSVTYNTNNNYNYSINTSLVNQQLLNTNLEDLKLGLKIELIDDNNNIISRNNYKNIKFIVNDNVYYPSYDNTTYIDLGYDYSSKVNLTINTSLDDDNLSGDNYKFKITSYLSRNNNLIAYESNSNILIPLVYKNNFAITNYGFDVNVNSSLIINKDINNNIEFNIKGKGSFNDANIRVSLYKKKELTAYNQEYDLVNISDYINENINLNHLNYNGNEYTNNTLNISFKDIEVTGYRLLFELYDGDTKVGEKYINIIVR